MYKILKNIIKIDRLNFDYKKNVEDGCMDLVFKNKNPEQKIDLREQIFMFAKENNFILLMSKPFGVSLEEIFLKITGENGIKILKMKI